MNTRINRFYIHPKVQQYSSKNKKMKDLALMNKIALLMDLKGYHFLKILNRLITMATYCKKDYNKTILK